MVNRKKHKVAKDWEEAEKELSRRAKESIKAYLKKLSMVFISLMSTLEKNDDAIRPSLMDSGSQLSTSEPEYNPLFS